MRRRLMGSTFLGSKNFLRYPGEGDNLNGGNDDGKPGGAGSQQQQSQQQVDPNAGGDDDDVNIDSLFKKQGDDDDIPTGDNDDDFGVGDSEVDDSAIDTEFEGKATALREQINGLLTNFVVKDTDIPDELGFADKGKAAEFMTTLQKRAVQQSMQIMNPVISHVMNLAVAKINNRLKTEVKQNGAKSTAKSEFDKLGFTDQADRSTALVFYKRALQSKMSPEKAATATQRAMAQLGKSPAAKKKSGGGAAVGKLEGEAALDSFFS